MESARELIRSLPSASTFEQLRQVAIQAGRQVAAEHEAEESHARAQAQAERDRQQREVNKSLLVTVGVACVSPYISKLHSAGELWDEDLSRKPELEAAVRKALEEKLTGTEGLEGAQRIAREIVNHELE